MNGVNYLLQTNFYLLLFMGFYVLVLRNETFFRQNRFFLNTSIFLSFLIPFINSDWFRDLFITQRVREAAIMPSQVMYETIIVGINDEAASLTFSDAIYWIYSAGAAFLLLRFLIRIVFLRSNMKAVKGTAFSFFKTMVVDTDMAEADTIIDHEKVHMRQWHSADIIFIELASIINWFNPVMYLYKKEIRHIHEFIADEEAAARMESKADYALLLFSNTLGVDPLHLSNNFFNKSLLKRRVLMLHRNKSRRTGLWKYGFSAPLFILMLIVSAATVKSEDAKVGPIAEKLLSPLNAKTSEDIMRALELNEKNIKQEKKSAEQPLVSVSNNLPELPFAPDYTALKKHIQKNIKYPLGARQDNITGNVVANFNIQDKKISSAQIEKGVQKDLDEEVIRTLKLFTAELDAPNGKYAIAVNFNLMGGDLQAVDVPNVGGENFVGQITVTAMSIKPKLDVKDFVGAQSAKSLALNEVIIGSDNPIRDFATLDVLPEFPGGMAGWGKYLQANLKYPKEARDNKITGRVILTFVVEKDGNLSGVKVLRGLGYGLDEEAVRVLQNSPLWRPGIHENRAVRVAYTMPIFFLLSSN